MRLQLERVVGGGHLASFITMMNWLGGVGIIGRAQACLEAASSSSAVGVENDDGLSGRS